MRESDETSGEMNTREAKPCEEGEALLLRHRLKANFGFSFFFLSPIIQIILTSEEISILELGTRWNSFIFFFFFRGRVGCNTVFLRLPNSFAQK